MSMYSPSLARQIFRIAGNRPNTIGTGFAIHRDDTYLYILTCRHVIDQVGEDGLTVEAMPARLICSDTKQGFDLAVLCVDAKHLDRTPFSFHPVGQSGMNFRSAGFYKLTEYSAAQDLNGTLRREIELFSPGLNKRTSAWWIEIQGDTRLEDGHSGAPVVNEHGVVVAVISVRLEDGQRGLAISIEALRNIWHDMPSNLFASPPKKNSNVQTTAPLMNCTREITAFASILSGSETVTRTIFLYGAHGCGKTRLLTEYRHLITEYQRVAIHFDLGQQLLVERCLERIASKIAGRQKFLEFRKILGREKPERLDKQVEWELYLTRTFFDDLDNFEGKPVFILFDQFEKADRHFQEWLLNVFVERLEDKPLIVVVAGREGLDRVNSYEWTQYFTPKIDEIDHFYNYAESFEVQVDPSMMEVLHGAFKTTPKSFVDFISTLRLQQQQGKGA